MPFAAATCTARFNPHLWLTPPSAPGADQTSLPEPAGQQCARRQNIGKLLLRHARGPTLRPSRRRASGTTPYGRSGAGAFALLLMKPVLFARQNSGVHVSGFMYLNRLVPKSVSGGRCKFRLGNYSFLAGPNNNRSMARPALGGMIRPGAILHSKRCMCCIGVGERGNCFNSPEGAAM